MNIKYSFKIYQGYSKKHLKICIEGNYGPLEMFLFSDIEWEQEQNEVLKAIDSVLNGNIICEEYLGSICKLIIEKNITKIYDDTIVFTTTNMCEIETSELKDLINIWLCEKKKIY